jgi:hypothetical protein
MSYKHSIIPITKQTPICNHQHDSNDLAHVHMWNNLALLQATKENGVSQVTALPNLKFCVRITRKSSESG